MHITDLTSEHSSFIEQAAALLVAEFAENWPDAWPDLNSALEEVLDIVDDEEKVCLVALADSDTVLGWIGGAPMYARVWELHPLVVAAAHQGKGIGRQLVQALEKRVQEKGALTLTLGTDDENNMTTLSGKDLYDDVFEHLTNIQNLKGHPYSFYQKLGFTIVGVMPDANGLGKPDIYMAKRIGEWQTG